MGSYGTLTAFIIAGYDLDSSICCENTEYCIVNESSLAVECCNLGSTCGSSCDQDSFYSLVTTTSTDASAASTSQLVVETIGTCLWRDCTGKTYKCSEAFSGECCEFGSECISGGGCFTSSEVTSTPTAVATDTASSTARATGFSNTSTAEDTSKISDDTQLKIGLGVGIPTAVIGFAVFAFVWRVRRARKQSNAPKDGDQEGYRKPELSASEIHPPVELETCVAELPAQILEAELPEQGIVAELPLAPAIDTTGDELAAIKCLAGDDCHGRPESLRTQQEDILSNYASAYKLNPALQFFLPKSRRRTSTASI